MLDALSLSLESTGVVCRGKVQHSLNGSICVIAINLATASDEALHAQPTVYQLLDQALQDVEDAAWLDR